MFYVVQVILFSVEGAPDWQIEQLYAWDDTTQQIIPAENRSIQALQKKGHFILNITNAYRTKMGLLQNDINGPLIAKRDSLVSQRAKLQARMDEVKGVKDVIERETRNYCDEISERLKATEKFKTSLLAKDMKEISTDIDKIQAFIEEVSASSKIHNMIEFLTKERVLKDSCDRMVKKPHKQDIDITASDFDHEAHAHKDLVKRYRAMQELIEMKDAMISQLLEDRKSLENALKQMTSKHQTEAAHLETSPSNTSVPLEEAVSNSLVIDGSIDTMEEPTESKTLSETGLKHRDNVDEANGDWLISIEHGGKIINIYKDGSTSK